MATAHPVQLFCFFFALFFFHASEFLLALKVQNYTIITSECKGPQYPVNACCPALVKFACPFADDINDNTTDCASTMFNYINIYGRYPPGLFANECRGDDKGLPCPSVSTVPSSHATLLVKPNRRLWWVISIISTFLVLYLYVGESRF